MEFGCTTIPIPSLTSQDANDDALSRQAQTEEGGRGVIDEGHHLLNCLL